MNREKLEEIKQDYDYEIQMRRDWEFALEHLGVSEEMTISDFAKVYKQLKDFGWDITTDELLDSIIGEIK